jgi:hypothetical protein
MKTIDVVSIAIGIVGLAYAFYCNRQITKGVKIGVLLQIRMLINRMSEEKKKQVQDSIAWSALHHSEQDLDATFKSIQAMFDVRDSETPLK